MNFVKFLFAGPLPFILQQNKEIKEIIVTLRQELTAYAQRIENIGGELRSDIQALKDALANVPVPDDVSDILARIGVGLTNLESLDQPNIPSPGEPLPEPEPETPVEPEPQPEPEPVDPQPNPETNE